MEQNGIETGVVAYVDCIHELIFIVYCIHKEHSSTRRLSIVSYIASYSN